MGALIRTGWAFALFLISASSLPQGIEQTKHNLTRHGPGTIKAQPQIHEELCIFCHTPHIPRAQKNLQYFGWNREESTATYTTYESSTMYAQVGQPTGASKLCLSCHDGTIALGAIKSQRNVIPFEGNWDESSSNLGTNLADDHPISFVYDSLLAKTNGELTEPEKLPDNFRLDTSGQMQCTTCHDAHDDSNGSFLVQFDPVRTLCVTCHQPNGYGQSAHANSTALWNGQGINPWAHTSEPRLTVAENTCQNCHQPHNAEGQKSLLDHANEEETCLKCHNGNVASTDIAAEIRKAYSHDVRRYKGLHLASELADYDQQKHVECVDCHNPHQVSDKKSERPNIPGSIGDVSGVSVSGDFLETATFTYEVCFKCHGGQTEAENNEIVRQIPQQNTRLEFSGSAISSHPIIEPRRNSLVPSLLPEFTLESQITCVDCHGSDTANLEGENVGVGPHGSNFKYILSRRYETLDNTLESYDVYALCYGCHDRNSILGDESFAKHDSHVRGQNTPCSVCHDPHGISETQANEANHRFLINFDINVVSPNALGNLYWEEGSQGPGSSRCSLACHGVDHNNTEDRPIGFEPTNGLSGSPNSWPFSGAFPD